MYSNVCNRQSIPQIAERTSLRDPATFRDIVTGCREAGRVVREAANHYRDIQVWSCLISLSCFVEINYHICLLHPLENPIYVQILFKNKTVRLTLNRQSPHQRYRPHTRKKEEKARSGASGNSQRLFMKLQDNMALSCLKAVQQVF